MSRRRDEERRISQGALRGARLSHDPRTRTLLGHCGEWEVRGMSPEDPEFRRHAFAGWLHLQLWHPETELSVLTATALTGCCLEVCCPGKERQRFTHIEHVISALRVWYRVPAPPRARLQAWYRWHVDRPELQARAACESCSKPT